jgi:uncharacterized membrane protein YhaH (DUF805 family)
MVWFLKVLSEYANFEGRASREEYWMYTLFSFIFLFVSAIFDFILFEDFGFFTFMFSFGTLIPSIAVAARRLHDTNKSAWLLFVAVVPLFGAILLLIYFVQAGDKSENKYGPAPSEQRSSIVTKSAKSGLEIVKDDGTYEKYYKSGKLMKKMTYVNGMKEGPFTLYHENGAVTIRVNFVGGKADGLYEEFYETGQIKERCNYVMGVKDGEFEKYDTSGKLLVSGIFKNGVISVRNVK